MLSGSAPAESLVAWHPDDEEHWFTTKEACREAAERAIAALRENPEAVPPGGAHIDCYDELHGSGQ
jgi:hypothetical protein